MTKKKSDDVTWKELVLGAVIAIILCSLIIWGINAKDKRVDKACTEKLAGLEDFKNCKYNSWSSLNDKLYKCYCTENNQIREFILIKEESYKK